MERDGTEVGCLLGRGADAVLDIGSALDREELGAGRGTPEKRHIRCMLGLVYAKHINTLLNTYQVRGQTFVCIQARKGVGVCRRGTGSSFLTGGETKVAAAVMMKLVSLDDTELQIEPAEDVKSGR